MRKARPIVLRAAMVCSAVHFAMACPAQAQEDFLKASPKDHQWFRDARFGAFICWGPECLGKGKKDWKDWNAPRFHAKEWAEMIQAAGAKYVIFTTRHGGKFSMFDTRLTGQKVTNTAIKRDVTAELVQACRKAGIRIVLYYNQAGETLPPEMGTPEHDAFIKHFHGQVRELCSNYGRIDGLWFDYKGWPPERWKSRELFRAIRKLQPGILINDRLGLPGDFDTPENHVGPFQLDRPWESCIRISRNWYWSDRASVRTTRSLKDCLHLLVRCAGAGGNLALSTGAMPDGRIPPLHATRYRDMGAWLRKYGESICGTVGGPYRSGPWGVSTRKGDRIYLHILNQDWVERGLYLPALGRDVLETQVLTGGHARIRRAAAGLDIHLDEDARKTMDTIIVLRVRGDTEEMQPITGLERGAISQGKTATASSAIAADHAPSLAVDGDDGTWWQGTNDTRVGQIQGKPAFGGWWQVDLGVPMAFERTVVWGGSANEAELQVKERDAWRTYHKGALGREFALKHKPITAQRFRLRIVRSKYALPRIREIQLFAAKQPSQ